MWRPARSCSGRPSCWRCARIEYDLPSGQVTAPVALSPSRSRISDVLTLMKVRVNTLVVATTAGGYVVGSLAGVHAGPLITVCVGTALVAGGAAGLNQIYERDIDRL